MIIRLPWNFLRCSLKAYVPARGWGLSTKAPAIGRRANDVIRASELSLLPRKNSHVTSDPRELKKEKPILLVPLVRGAHIKQRSARPFSLSTK
jgi:hypothetical protein